MIFHASKWYIITMVGFANDECCLIHNLCVEKHYMLSGFGLIAHVEVVKTV